MKIPRGLNRKIVELITSQAYYQCLLTMFANSEPVRGFEEGALQMCFADLRQNLINEHQLLFFKLLDLFMTWDWSTYFHDYGQENSKYLRVNPQVAVVLLEKIPLSFLMLLFYYRHILREVLTKIIAHYT
ncbi:exocyst complex component 6-like isoform X1 [Tachypleus tridentatus]|uniref:exocyst complex component 6-like isoform X1 n=2 Tax=Tachypleus tridentatus TaxID=6853 RepID=UPI003FD04E1A